MCIDVGYYETFNRPNVRLVNLEAHADRGGHARRHPRRRRADRARRAGAGDRLRRHDRRAAGRRHPRPRRPVAAREVGARARARTSVSPTPGSRTCSRITGPSSPSVLSNVMVSIEQHVELVAEAAAPPARARPGLDRADRGGRGGLGRPPPRARRCVAVPAGELLVHGRQRARQAPRAPALRRRRRAVPEDLRAGRRAGYEGFALRGPGGRELAVVPAGVSRTTKASATRFDAWRRARRPRPRPARGRGSARTRRARSARRRRRSRSSSTRPSA